MKRPLVIGTVTVLGLLALAGTLGWRAHKDAPRPAPKVPASAGIVAEARVTANPGFDVNVSADFVGTLAHVYVQEGDTVHVGAQLVDFDASVQRAALAAAEARVSQAQADIRLAALRVRRGAELLKKHALPQEDLDERRRDLEVAQAQLHTAQSEAKELRAEISHSIVTAPIGGTVLSRLVQPGETVDRGTPLLRLADLTRLRLTADVDEFDASAVRVGDPVVITAEGFPGRQWRGRVEEIPPVVTGRQLEPLNPAAPTDVGVVRVKITLPKHHPFRIGQRVEVRIYPNGSGH